jgi:hypothetical protein
MLHGWTIHRKGLAAIRERHRSGIHSHTILNVLTARGSSPGPPDTSAAVWWAAGGGQLSARQGVVQHSRADGGTWHDCRYTRRAHI